MNTETVNTETVKAHSIVFEEEIYPRVKPDENTIESYADSMKIGATFPPLTVQYVTNYLEDYLDSEVLLLIDGKHRREAYAICEIDEIEVEHWQEDVLDYPAWKVRLRIESLRRNRRHGDRVTEGDGQATIEFVATNDPNHEWTNQMIADELEYSIEWVEECTSPIRAKQRAGRDGLIIKLSRLGWTQQDIADLLDLSQPAIAKIITNQQSLLISDNLKKGMSIGDVAELNSLDLPTTWGIHMEEFTDQERFAKKNLNWGLRTYDGWSFNSPDARFGDTSWPGRIPAQLIAHTLFYFSEDGDRVFDPMTGGGTTTDVCLAFNRKCDAFDLHYKDDKPEIRQHYWEAGNMQWPKVKKPDLIFFDPPYFDKMKGDYEKLVQNGETPVSSLDRYTYLDFFYEFFVLAKANSKPTTRLAFLNADWRDYMGNSAMEEDENLAITMVDYARLMEDAGWTITHMIDAPLSTQQLNGYAVKSMQKNRTMAVLRRTLIMAKI